MHRQRGRFAFWGLGLLGTLAWACDGGAARPEATACNPTVNSRGLPVGCAAGTLVAPDGTPAAGVRVSACTLSTCIIGTTNAEGDYLIQGLPVAPHKMELLGFMQGFMTTVFYQDILPGVLVTAPRPIIVPRLAAAGTQWPTTGGDVTLAGGRLTIGAAAGVVTYPIGTEVEEVEAVEFTADELPPFDIEPWKGNESKSFAFVLNPFPLQVRGDWTLQVNGVQGAPGARFRLYGADHLLGTLEELGTLTLGADGVLTLDDGAEQASLTTLVVVPDDEAR